MSVSAALTLAPGWSPCRLRSAARRSPSRNVAAGPTYDTRKFPPLSVCVRSFIGGRSFFLNCLVCAAHKDRSGISGLADAVPVDPACWEARSYCRAEAWLVAYELAVGELSACPAHRDFLPWWAAMGGCRLSAWPSRDVKPPVHVPEGDKRSAARGGRTGRRGLVPRAGEREKPPPMGSGRHQAIADATGEYVPG